MPTLSAASIPDEKLTGDLSLDVARIITVETAAAPSKRRFAFQQIGRLAVTHLRVTAPFVVIGLLTTGILTVAVNLGWIRGAEPGHYFPPNASIFIVGFGVTMYG